MFSQLLLANFVSVGCILLGTYSGVFSFPCRARVVHFLSLARLVVVKSWGLFWMGVVFVIIHSDARVFAFDITFVLVMTGIRSRRGINRNDYL